MNLASRLALPFFAILICAPCSAAVWTVDASGAGHFTDLPQAVQAAAPGDALILRAGRYSACVISKPLALVGTGQCLIRGQMTIQNIGPGQCFALSGILFLSTSTPPAILVIRNCAGLVNIERCEIGDFYGMLLGFGGLSAALQIENSSQVVLHDCHCFGSGGDRTGPDGHCGVLIQGSTVRFYSCEINGGAGYTEQSLVWGGTGGTALWVQNTVLLLSNTSVVGGRGASTSWYGMFWPAPPAGNGGTGLVASSSSIESRGGSVQGGPAGCVLDMFGCISQGSPGQASSGNASWSVHAEPYPALTLTAPLERGRDHPLEVRIGRGGIVLVFFSLGKGGPLPIPGIEGLLWMDPSSIYLAGIATGPYSTRPQLPFPLDADPWLLGACLVLQPLDVSGTLGEVAIDYIR